MQLRLARKAPVAASVGAVKRQTCSLGFVLAHVGDL
jgi:hypothetical protein